MVPPPRAPPLLKDEHACHFCECKREVKVLERYACGTRLVDVAIVGVCCTCGKKARQFCSEHMRDPGEPDDPGPKYWP